MSAVVERVTPQALLRCFQAGGFELVNEDPFHWFFADGDTEPPFAIPKRGRFVSVEILEKAKTWARPRAGCSMFHDHLETELAGADAGE